MNMHKRIRLTPFDRQEINAVTLEQEEILVEAESKTVANADLLLALGPIVSNKEWQE